MSYTYNANPEIVTVNGADIKVKTVDGQRVLTIEDIAAVFEYKQSNAYLFQTWFNVKICYYRDDSLKGYYYKFSKQVKHNDDQHYVIELVSDTTNEDCVLNGDFAYFCNSNKYVLLLITSDGLAYMLNEYSRLTNKEDMSIGQILMREYFGKEFTFKYSYLCAELPDKHDDLTDKREVAVDHTDDMENKDMNVVDVDATVIDTNADTAEAKDIIDFVNTVIDRDSIEKVKSEKFGELSIDLYRKKDNKDDIWFTKRQIGEALEYKDPQWGVDRIVEKNKERLSKFSVTTKLMATDGKSYNTTLFNRRGVMEICRFSKQPKANLLYDWIYDIVEAYLDGELRSVKVNTSTTTPLSFEEFATLILLKEQNENKIMSELIQSQTEWMREQQRINEENKKEVLSYIKMFGNSVITALDGFSKQNINNQTNLNSIVRNVVESVQKNLASQNVLSNTAYESTIKANNTISSLCEYIKKLSENSIPMLQDTVIDVESSTESKVDENICDFDRLIYSEQQYDVNWKSATFAWANIYAGQNNISNSNVVLNNMYLAINFKNNCDIKGMRDEFAKRNGLGRLTVIDFIANFKETRDMFDKIKNSMNNPEDTDRNSLNGNGDSANTDACSKKSAYETKNYPEFSKRMDNGESIADIAQALGISKYTLYKDRYLGRYKRERATDESSVA